MVVVQRQSELMQVVLARCPPRRLPRLLHCGQEQRNQDRNDCDHDQQLNQRERPPTTTK
jgi:hypothetical protein